MQESAITITIQSLEPTFLSWLQGGDDTEDDATELEMPVVFGEVSEVRGTNRLGFGPIDAMTVAYQVTSVIATVGGAIQFVDWLVTKIGKARQARITKSLVLDVSGNAELLSSEKSDEQNQKSAHKLFSLDENQ